MKLIVGLGNPGALYAQTRHNVGWQVVDELARQEGAAWRKDGEAEVAELRLSGEKALLVKPQTFMNASGRAVAPLVRFYKLGLADLLSVQDDLDSPFGLVRLRRGGRSGGQNGVGDLIARLGSPDFARLKIGISRPPQGWAVSDWVLSKWRPEEQDTLRELVQIGVGAVRTWAARGLPEAQRAVNGTDLRPKDAPGADAREGQEPAGA